MISEARIVNSDPELFFYVPIGHFRVGRLPGHLDLVVLLWSVAAIAPRTHANLQISSALAAIEVDRGDRVPFRGRVIPHVLIITVGAI